MKCHLPNELCKYTLIHDIVLYRYFTYFITENAKKEKTKEKKKIL